MFLLRLITIIVFFFALITQSAFCATYTNYKVKDIMLDNSDRMVLIKGQGNFKLQNNAIYAPTPVSNTSSVNILTSISTFTITAPTRYVVDIPNATLVGSSRTYKLNNSNVVQSVQLSQFSANPHIVRAVFTLKNDSDLSKFKTYTNGEDIIVKYNPSIIDNSLRYKFYTPTGDQDKNAQLQDLSATLTYNNTNETVEITPTLTSKYYLGQISQSSDGLILRGIGSLSLQRANYNSDNTKAVVVVDNAVLSDKLENKTFDVPSSNKNIKTTLTINRLNSKKVQLTLLGENLRDYRFIIAPDNQSLFITHRSYIINTVFSSDLVKTTSYKASKTQNGYVLFDFNFSSPVAYDVFELNDNFYIDINNLSDYSPALFEKMLETSDIKLEALKISKDKTRFIIPSKNLNFSYANVESNAKSISLCFKEKLVIATSNQTKEVPVSNIETKNPATVQKPANANPQTVQKQENINVVYIPKEDDQKEKEYAKPKKTKETSSISSLKKVVLDPGHGGSDTGAIGDGNYEKTINLAVALMVQEKLQKKNVHVYMTRDKDKTLTLEDRTVYSNEINPNIFVSIHVNSTVAKDPFGLETHYYKDDSYDLAQTIHSNFASEKNLKKWETKDRGVIKSRFYVINHIDSPGVLIEIGFISNAQEREKLLTKQRQEEIAESITKGILEYLKVK